MAGHDSHYWLLITALLLASAAQYSRGNSLIEEQAILKNIFRNYDKMIRPSGENDTGPVPVSINMFVRYLGNLDDVNMAYDTQLTFRQAWKDDRLRYESKDVDYVSISNPAVLWIPDLFISNEMSGHFHKMITPNNLIRIYPNGNILYSTRISLRLSCPMDLKNYPLDDQTCSIYMASYGYTTRDIEFVWKDGDPVQMSKRLHQAKFELHRFTTDYCTSKTNTGEYSCLKMSMHFSRRFFFYLESMYMPSTTLVLLSWIPFWIHPRHINLRFGIWCCILLSAVLVTTNVNSKTPNVSYTKAIDVWLGSCYTFILCVMVELLIASRIAGNHDGSGLDSEEKDKPARSYQSTPLRWLNRFQTRSQRLDAAARFLFPVAFLIFNAFYWISYS